MRGAALAQEMKEFDAFTQPPLHHLRAADHFADDGSNLAGAEIEAAVEFLDRVEDFAVAQMRIVQRRDLHAVFVDELGMRIVEPAVLHRLIEQEGARIRRGERNLDRMRIDLGAKWMVSSMVSLVSPGSPIMKVP